VNFSFTSDLDLKRTVDLLAGPRLWINKSVYPDFLDWLDRAALELHHGVKRGIYCYYDGKMVGAAIYQRHKTIPSFLELKNLTVLPEAGRRFVASFLVRNAEVEGSKEFKPTHIVCDAKRDNVAIQRFLTSNKYRATATIDLYGLDAGADILYVKALGDNP